MAVTVVFDTNVLFSATGWKGPPNRCHELARTRRIESVTCWELLAELAEKLTLKLEFSEERTTATINDLLSFHRLVELSGTVQACRDADDNAALECALLGDAKYILTGDKDLLVLKEFRGVTIITPAEFERAWNSGLIQ